MEEFDVSDLPNSIKSIDEVACFECEWFKSITLPDSAALIRVMHLMAAVP